MTLVLTYLLCPTPVKKPLQTPVIVLRAPAAFLKHQLLVNFVSINTQ